MINVTFILKVGGWGGGVETFAITSNGCLNFSIKVPWRFIGLALCIWYFDRAFWMKVCVWEVGGNRLINVLEATFEYLDAKFILWVELLLGGNACLRKCLSQNLRWILDIRFCYLFYLIKEVMYKGHINNCFWNEQKRFSYQFSLQRISLNEKPELKR